MPTSSPAFEPSALLNDDTTEVGAVHLGVVVVADAAGRPVRVRETDKLTGAFATPAEVAAVARRPRDVEPARVRRPRGGCAPVAIQGVAMIRRPPARRRAVPRCLGRPAASSAGGRRSRLLRCAADDAGGGRARPGAGRARWRGHPPAGPRRAAPGRPLAPGRRPATARWRPDPHEAILLLHGYTGSIAPDLVEYGPYLRRTAAVLGLDFRGHGDSDDGPSTFGAARGRGRRGRPRPGWASGA